MPLQPNFADGEKVLCYYGPLLYEAKALKSSITKDKQVKYFIHYAGWNKKWDEWVDEKRLLEFNDINVQRKEDLTILHASTSKNNTLRKSKRRSQHKNRNKRSKNKKRLSDPSKKVEIEIPEELKPWLINDWHAINRQHKLLEIPAKNTVKDIIDSYIQMQKSNKSADQGEEEALIDVMDGLVAYFNMMLDSQLLYKSERPQYADILKEYPDTPMANLYSSFHLLRLFVRLGSVLEYTALGEKDIDVFMQHVQDFLKYLVENIGIYYFHSLFY